eukprot:TRINITY_DN7085_c0_g1_i1.p1 TRINITY_DN7085_c0_g1~~TRINITY_DN7085_c0_g1_i1.p1  ORF type:complete len:148 (+),score=1.63 TRINITY_DN7085_c0_g1_i1:66-509(+)
MEDFKPPDKSCAAVPYGYRDDMCSVCLEAYDADNNPATLYLCGHAFHLQCAETWRQRRASCPLCWEPLEELGLCGPEWAMPADAPLGDTPEGAATALIMAGEDMSEASDNGDEAQRLVRSPSPVGATTAAVRPPWWRRCWWCWPHIQ